MIEFADVIVDLQYGDTGKGKVAHDLAGRGVYNMVLRYNGGSNAGHTVYVGGRKIVTHQIPVGVLHGITSVIGPGCVVNLTKLMEEVKYLESEGFNVMDFLRVDRRVNLVTLEHVEQDSHDTAIGTTRQGIGPAYRDKYGRVGTRLEECLTREHLIDDEKKTFVQTIITDLYELFHLSAEPYRVLCEGAQGFHLDIDWGEYPYVTSSHCHVGAVVQSGIPPHKIRHIIGTAKAYETYVGNRTDYMDEHDPVLVKLQEAGNEYGATTGRKRKTGYLHLNRLVQAANINGIASLVINKADVLELVGTYPVYNLQNSIVTYTDKDAYKDYVRTTLIMGIPTLREVIWSESPHTI